MTLDAIVEAIRELLRTRFPDAEWASLVIERPNTPKTVIVVRPGDQNDAAGTRACSGPDA